MLKHWLYLTGVLTLFSCSSQQGAIKPDFDERISLLSDQSQTVGSGNDAVVIKVKAIEDSRCPNGVQCVWEGYVDVAFILSNRAGEQVFSLCLGKCQVINKAAKLNVFLGVKGYEVTLLGVGKGEDKAVIFSVNKI